MGPAAPEPVHGTPVGPVGRTTLVLAPIALVARGVAFLVPVLVAHLFGVSGVTDAFFYALAFPTFLLVIVGNAVGAAATPALARVSREDPHAVDEFVGTALVGVTLASLVVGVGLLAALAPALPALTDFDPDVRRLTWRFVAELLPFMALIGAVVPLKAACEIRGRFVPVALGPMLRGVGVMTTLVALHGALGPHVLPAAMFAGQAVELAWLLAVLARAGVRPAPSRRLHPRLVEAGRDVLPVLAGELLVALNVVIDKAFAGALAPGSVSLLEYADRARFIPQTLMESSLLPVAFATWSVLAAAGRRRELAASVDQALRWLAAWTAAPLAGLYIGRFVLVRALFERGAFVAADTEAAASALGWYLPGLWTMMLGALAMRAHVVERRLRLVMILGVTSVVANTLLDAVLSRSLGIDGLAMASSAVWVVVPAGYLAGLRPTLRGVSRLSDWIPVGAIALASLAVALAVELGPGPPRALQDPLLWLAALPCLALLAVAVRVTRPPARSPA